MIPRRPSKPPNMAPRPLPPATGLRGGGYKGASVNKGRADIKQVAAYTEGIKGAEPPKTRKRWY